MDCDGLEILKKIRLAVFRFKFGSDDAERHSWPLGKVLSGKQHPNLQDLGKLRLLGGGSF